MTDVKKIRNDALEEAAQWHDERHEDAKTFGETKRALMHERSARAIRALKGPEE